MLVEKKKRRLFYHRILGTLCALFVTVNLMTSVKSKISVRPDEDGLHSD